MDESNRSFGATYDAWFLGSPEDRRRLDAELRTTYRQAWRSREKNDRHSALMYVFHARLVEGFDLVVRSLADRDDDLAKMAIANTFALLALGFDLGPDVRGAIEAVRDRFPDRQATAEAALRELAARQNE
jgi:hypothetical protein